MKRLYVITVYQQTMYLSDEKHAEENGKLFRKEEEEICPNSIDPFEVKEITSKEQIPKAWQSGALLWGTDEDITAKDFLNRPKDPEYDEYLRLKAKFE